MGAVVVQKCTKEGGCAGKCEWPAFCEREDDEPNPLFKHMMSCVRKGCTRCEGE